ncbi:MAG TPA: SagB family peptide dehydrogenase [Pseudonocardiaceae bacterium]
MSTAADYLHSVLYRAREPFEPVGFQPDWGDRPRAEKYYQGVESFPLPTDGADTDATLQDSMIGTDEAGDQPFTIDALGSMLFDSYGQLSRRLAVHANKDFGALSRYDNAIWSRGTSSGGGLYPVSIYWVSGANGPMLPGVYHYSARQHAVQRLLTGDVSGEVRAAVGDPELTGHTDQYLVLGIKFWQNAFKYNSFSYHAVSMDIGTVVETWRVWARARGRHIRPVLWFDETRVSDLLGIDNIDEGVFAVVPLTWAGPPAPAQPDAHRQTQPSVRITDEERSRRVIKFPILQDLQAAISASTNTRPAWAAVSAATQEAGDDGPRIELPTPRALDIPVRSAVRARRSSFGRFSAEPPLPVEKLSTVLAGATAGAVFPCDVLPGDPADRLVTFYVFANHVDGVEPGSYEFEPTTNTLRQIHAGPPGEFLQRNYFLTNYSVDQAAAVVVPAVRYTAVLDTTGDRGYRLVNAVIGALAQATYTTCAALGIGCGAALGFDNVSYMEELGIAGTDQSPLLIMMVGNERSTPANFRYELD